MKRVKIISVAIGKQIGLKHELNYFYGTLI